jgi:hypothetical protein
LFWRFGFDQHLPAWGQEGADPTQERHGIPTDADTAIKHKGPIPLSTSGNGIEDGVEDHRPLTALCDSDEVGGQVHAQDIDPSLCECLDMAARTAAHVEHGSAYPLENPQVHGVGVVQPTIDLELANAPIGEPHPGPWGD